MVLGVYYITIIIISYILYITIIILLLYIYIILYYTLPSPILFFLPLSSSLLFFLPNIPLTSSHSSHLIPIFILYLSVLTYTYLYSSSDTPLSSPSQYSFYTCRYLHILIYIPDSSSKYLTPHVLSEWMVEV
jgi:hypothetical protein